MANELIDPELSKLPPTWSAERWAGLAGVLDIAMQDSGEMRCTLN